MVYIKGIKMGRRMKSGNSISMNHEVNMKGDGVLARSTKCREWPDLTTPTPDHAAGFSVMIPVLMGILPVSAGGKSMEMALAALGAVSMASNISLTPDASGNGFIAAYINVVRRLMTGAYAPDGPFDEAAFKKMMMALIARMLQAAGPGCLSWKDVLTDAMQRSVLEAFMKGAQETVCAMTGDPVNANTGNFVYEKEDICVKGGTPLSLKRFYNCIDTRSGSMGMGWRHNHEIQLLLESDRYTVLWGDGREEVYLKDEDSSPVPLFSGYDNLKVNGNGFLYTDQKQQTCLFDGSGRLMRQSSEKGMEIHYAYDKRGRLLQVTNRDGCFLRYCYDDFTGLLKQVQDHTGRSVVFSYELGSLKRVQDAEGGCYIYSYGSDKRISSISNPQGICILRNTYDKKGRTVLQKFADEGEITYDYQEELGRTLVTEQNGNKVAYVHDDRYRNVASVYADGEERFCFNRRNQVILKTDKKGNQTTFSYDRGGNVSRLQYADKETHDLVYDDHNRLQSWSVNGTIKIKNTYDSQGNLVRTADAQGRCLEMSYDSHKRISELVLPDGNRISFTYGQRGNISHISDSTARHVSYEYDDCNRIIRVTDGEGNPVGFTYDACNRITSITNAKGERRLYEYTKNGRVSRLTDYNGAVYTWEYNCMNQVKSFQLPDGERMELEYDLMQNVTRRIYPNGAEETYFYDKQSRLEKKILPNGGIIHYTYDRNGNLLSKTDPEENRREFEYDERNRITQMRSPSGSVTEYEYDMEGRLICIRNAAGQMHTYDYNENGQLIGESSFSGNSRRYTYDKNTGNVSSVTDAERGRTEYEYYPGGRISRIMYPNGAYETFEYNRNGKVIRRQNHKGIWLEFDYDCLNRLSSVRSSFGQKKQYCYDAAGNRISKKDTFGNETKYAYSPGGKLLSVTDAKGNRTEYSYDAMGKLSVICQHEGSEHLLDRNGKLVKKTYNEKELHITRYQRNQMGHVECATDPLGFCEYYTYDLLGRLVRKTDRDGYETRYGYNEEGKRNRIQYGDGREAEFSYDCIGRLERVTDWLGTIEVERDESGNIKRIRNQKGEEISYVWGMTGKQEAMVYPDGKKAHYEYDEYGRLRKLCEGKREILYHYDEEGRLREKQYQEGISSHYAYDDMGFLKSLIHQKQGEILEQYEYEYDLAGNKKSIRKKRSADGLPAGMALRMNQKAQGENGLYEYRYDSLNQLTEVWKDGRILRTFTYDAFGNRIRQEDEKGRIRYIYNAGNQLIRVESASASEAWEYDARGNLISIREGNELVKRYQYGTDNRLERAVNRKGQAACYEYDGLGNRTAVKEYQAQACGLLDREEPFDETCLEKPVRTTEYISDPLRQGHPLLSRTERTEQGKRRQDFVRDSDPALVIEGEHACIYLHDEMGSTLRLMDTQRNRQTIYGYDEFGEDLYGEWDKRQPFGYTGYQRDDVAGTYFAQAREYLPKTGRFAGRDWLKGHITKPATLNEYGYCLGNPVNRVDPDGKRSQNANHSSDEIMDWYFSELYEAAEKAFEETWNDLMDAIDEIVDVQGEFGVGLGGSGTFGPIKGEAEFKPMYYEFYEDFETSLKAALGVRAGINEDLKISAGIDVNHLTDEFSGSIGVNNWNLIDMENFDFSNILKFKFGGTLYLGIGGGGTVTIDLGELGRRIGEAIKEGVGRCMGLN